MASGVERHEKSQFAEALAASHRREGRLFPLGDNVDRTLLNDEDGIGNLSLPP